VPVALIGSCAVMYLWGFSLNNLSLMALIVATGLVVDDAIVVLENISRHVEEGMTPLQAAYAGSKEVGFTLLSMNLSIVAVFVSILFMGGIVERLFREFSITLVSAILISLVVSITLTPMLCARWLVSREEDKPGRLQAASDRAFGWLRRGYGRSLDWALAHSPIVLMIFLGVAAFTVHLYINAPKSFLPQQDTGQLGGFIRGDDGMSFQIMQPKIDAFRQAVLRDPAVESVAGFIGGGRGINNAQIFVRLKPIEERKVSAQVVAERIRLGLPKVPGARLWLNVDQDIRFGGGFGGGSYRYTLRSDNVSELRLWAQRVREALKPLPELTGIEDDLVSSQQITLEVDREAARRLGIEMNTVTQALNNAFGQRQVSTIYNAMNQYRVVMEVAPQFAQGPESLDQVHVVTAAGNRVPLSVFSHYTRSSANDRVSRSDQFASESVSFELAPGVSLSQAQAAIDAAVSRLTLPTSIQGRLQGNASLFTRMQGNQPLAILGTLLIVYIVLGVLYESYVHPLTILSTLPSAGAGALLALLLLKTEFSLVALLGLFLLIGIVMKNAILMIDVALQREREAGATPEEAIREACLLRLRPILMTTMSAMLGALPLMLGTGQGAEMRQPLGIAIVGGLFVSQVLTLYTTPVVYLYLENMRVRVNRWRGRTVADERMPGIEVAEGVPMRHA
jgi:multidrug efflux pump